MARWLALEWDQREVRAVLAARRGKVLELEDAFALPLVASGAAVPAASEIAALVADALAQRGAGKVETLVAIGRANIELRLLTLPPAPEEEVPQLVRFQALREFHSLAEDWPLDYTPLAGYSNTVLAAATAPETLQHVHEVCAAAGIKASRLALRPAAAAALLRRRARTTDSAVRLLIDVLPDEADLSVLINDDLVFTRTARLPGVEDAAEREAALQAEIRRTIIAARNQQPGGKVSSLYLCGSPQDDSALAAALQERLQLPVEILDPLEQATLSQDLKRNIPVGLGRYAPLVGLLLDEAEQLRPAFDFLSPRKHEPRRAPRRTLALVATLVAVLLLCVAGWAWASLGSLDDEAEQLARRSKQLDIEVKAAAALQKETAEIDDWAASDIDWLDELDYVSRKFPPAQEAIVRRLRVLPEKVGGRIEFDAAARTSPVIESAEQSLRDTRHTVTGQGARRDTEADRYPWQFGAAVKVMPTEPGATP